MLDSMQLKNNIRSKVWNSPWKLLGVLEKQRYDITTKMFCRSLFDDLYGKLTEPVEKDLDFYLNVALNPNYTEWEDN